MKNKKKLETFKNIFLSALIILIVVVKRNDFAQAMSEMAKIPMNLIFILVLLSLLYIVIEGLVYKVLLAASDFKLDSFKCINVALHSFGARILSFGSASAAGTIIQLNKYDVPPFIGTSMSMLSFLIQKISIGIMGVAAFFIHYQYITTNFKEYLSYFIIGNAILVLICLGFILLGISSKLHQFILWLCHKLDFKKKHEAKINDLATKLTDLKQSFAIVFKEPKYFLITLGLNVLKWMTLYAMPYILLHYYTNINYLTVLAHMCLVTALASVIPAPSGIGSTEYVFTFIFASFASYEVLLSIVLLYRFFYYLFSGVVGVVWMVIENFLKKEV